MSAQKFKEEFGAFYAKPQYADYMTASLSHFPDKAKIHADMKSDEVTDVENTAALTQDVLANLTCKYYRENGEYKLIGFMVEVTKK